MNRDTLFSLIAGLLLIALLVGLFVYEYNNVPAVDSGLTAYEAADFDGDGIINAYDDDIDGDGIPNFEDEELAIEREVTLQVPSFSSGVSKQTLVFPFASEVMAVFSSQSSTISDPMGEYRLEADGVACTGSGCTIVNPPDGRFDVIVEFSGLHPEYEVLVTLTITFPDQDPDRAPMPERKP